MPRSSKHKSSKHSSRDSREYSDSEKDSSLKDRKGKEESSSKVSKDSSSSEKRKLDSRDVKDVHGSGNGEYSDEYGSSKRRKEQINDAAGDRWNDDEEDLGEGSKKSKKRDESVGVYGEGEEVKKSIGKNEGRYKDSGRKESRESGAEKDRKSKEGRSERLADNEQRSSKQVFENTDSKVLVELQSPDLENQLEKSMRKRRGYSGDGDKHQDDVGDGYDKHLFTKDGIAKDGRQKDERRKDEKYRDKYKEEMDRENKHRHDKQRDGRPAKDHTSKRSDDKYTREEKDDGESQKKRIKLPEHRRDRDRDKYKEEMDRENKHRHDKQRDGRPAKDHTSKRSDDKYTRKEKDDVESRKKRIKLPEHHRDRDRDYNHDGDGDHDVDSGRGCEHNQDGSDYDLDRDRNYDRDQYWDCDRDRDHDWDHDRDRDSDRCLRRDGSHVNDRSVRSKESGAKTKILDDRDDYCDAKSGVRIAHYLNAEKRSVSSGRADSDDRGRSQSRQSHTELTGTSNKQRSSPIPNSHIDKDRYRNVNFEDSRCKDSLVEQRTKGSKEGFSGLSERGSKYKSMEKTIKIDDGPVGDLSTERSSSSKASPLGLVERSPSSSSIDRRYVNRGVSRRSLENEETGWRNSVDARDLSTSEDRPSRELLPEKMLLDESSQPYLSLHGRTSQGILPRPAFRAELDRTLIGSLEDDVRDNSNARYRRSSDVGFGRGHSNSWRGVPNWTSSVPNGFVPFQHGPGGFQAMMPQFSPQSLFGSARPPFGWQNMMDGTGPPHLPGWDGINGVFRNDPHMYGGTDWEQNRHLTNIRGWESSSETWKEQNGDPKKDLHSPASKDESVPALTDDGLAQQAIQMSQDEHFQYGNNEKVPETKTSNLISAAKAFQNALSTSTSEKVPDIKTPFDKTYLSCSYLSKLDISAELALPELYDQCMGLLNVEKKANVAGDAGMDFYLKDGSKARKKYAASFSKHSPFPAIDTSVFQRAIDLYKKQRLAMPDGGKLDIIEASIKMEVDEPVTVPVPEPENMGVSVSTSDAVADRPMPTSDLKELQIISPAKEDLDELDTTCSQERQDHVCNHSLTSALSEPSSGPQEPLPILNEKGDEFTSEPVISRDAKENHSMAVTDASVMVLALQAGDGKMNNSKAESPDFAPCGDEKPGVGETLGNPLIFDGSPKACDALMPGSNESESLILSRIHHSPESTH